MGTFGDIKDFLTHLMPGNTVNYVVNHPPELPQPVRRDPLDQRFLDAIAYNETRGVQGNKYASSQPSGNPQLGNAMGRYRVTENELKTYGKRYLGQDTTSRQFQNTPAFQDQYMKEKFNYFTRLGYTPQQIADIHNKGFTKSAAPGTAIYQNPKYVDSFNKAFMVPRTISALTP